MRKIFILLSIILFSTLADAQFIKEKSLTVHIGNASSSIDLINVSTGFYAQGEFAFKVIPWLEFRSYVGYVFGNTNILLTGGKARIRPFYMRHLVSWFSTYVDLGIGASIVMGTASMPKTALAKTWVNINMFL